MLDRKSIGSSTQATHYHVAAEAYSLKPRKRDAWRRLANESDMNGPANCVQPGGKISLATWILDIGAKGSGTPPLYYSFFKIP